MSIDLTTEILSAHADQLNRGETLPTPVYADMLSEPRGELDALMRTARRTKRALAPVTIAPAFRARLRDGLTMAAQHKESQRVLMGRHDPAWGWVIGAAAIGSAAGLIAIAWRARHTPRAATAVIAPELPTPPAGIES